MSADDYLIREAIAADASRIVSLLLEHYIPEENIYQSYMSKHGDEIGDDLTKQMLDSLSNAIRELLQENIALVVVHRASKAVVGHLIMQPQNKPNTPEEEKLAEYEDMLASVPKVIVDLVKHVEDINRRANVYDAFPLVSKSLKLRYLGLHPDHRRKGLSTLLIRAGVDYARRNNYLLAQGIFSSVFSQRAAEAAGLNCIFKCHLNDFKDDNGEPAFANVSPDSFICVMAIEPAKKTDEGIAKYLVS